MTRLPADAAASVPLLDPTLFPQPAARALALRVIPAAERALRAGHPWVFESSIERVKGSGRSGDPAVVFDRKNRFLAAGLWDAEGPIRFRALAIGAPEPVGPALFEARIRSALRRRAPLVQDPGTTGIRLVHGEGDGLSGLVVDLFGAHAVLKVYSGAWLPHLAAIAEALDRVLCEGEPGKGASGDGGLGAPEGLLLLASRRVAAELPPGVRLPALLRGSLPAMPQVDSHGTARGASPPYGFPAGPPGVPPPAPGTLPFLEGGLRFEAHPLVGHKTGFYLDQRENRARLAALDWAGVGGTGHRRVLNVFSYTGGFSLAAARSGAREVTSLDTSGAALAQAERHLALQGGPDGPPSWLQGVRHRTLEADAFEAMERLAHEGARYEVVVVDPPSFAKEERQAARALAQYGRLTRLALGLLAPGGLLVQASCSSRVAAEDLFARIHEEAHRLGRPLQEEVRTGHPLDHPVGIPENAYLKALWARG